MNAKINLEAMTGPELTAYYNSLVPAEKQIKKFDTKAVGIKRIKALMANNPYPAGSVSHDIFEGNKDVAAEAENRLASDLVSIAKEAKSPATKKAAKAPKAPKAESTRTNFKASRGVSRFDFIVGLLRDRAHTLEELIEECQTSRAVISNDLCDIRKSLGDEEKLVRVRENGVTQYHIEAV